ncbi:hypothetical protein Taro_029628 [Colocasia esculenta]|uniref:Uncharacterized protein n=1 Tax=Colocasia esculenta TaxID=4460 RepID=A0A843VKB1_COLES|nr:hypothetical protein [Colocasia esculenta]
MTSPSRERFCHRSPPASSCRRKRGFLRRKYPPSLPSCFLPPSQKRLPSAVPEGFLPPSQKRLPPISFNPLALWFKGRSLPFYVDIVKLFSESEDP